LADLAWLCRESCPQKALWAWCSSYWYGVKVSMWHVYAMA
jgi:hypothetical protein